MGLHVVIVSQGAKLHGKSSGSGGGFVSAAFRVVACLDKALCEPLAAANAALHQRDFFTG